MSRYLLGILLGFIALATLYGVSNSRDVVNQVNRSREVISASPAGAQQLSPIEGAGRNVTRQTSAEGIEQVIEEEDPQPETAPATTVETPVVEETAPAETAPPASSTNNQEPIPALW